MKKLLIALLTLGSFSAFSQNLLTTKILNTRTGESIGIECLERNNDQCFRFQYWAASSIDADYSRIGKPLEVNKVDALLKEKKEHNEEDIFDSNRLLLVSTIFDSPEFFSPLKGMYKRGKYQSGTSHALQVAGATVALVPMTFAGVLMSTPFLVADIVLLPIRGVGKIFQKNHAITGSERKQLKAILKIQEAFQRGEEIVEVKTNTWKKIYDGISSL